MAPIPGISCIMAGVSPWIVVAAVFTDTANTNSDTSTVIDLPSSILSGDLLIAFVAHHNRRASSWPTGWTEIADDFASGTIDDGAASIAWRLANGSEGSTVTVTSEDDTYSSAGVIQIRGADTVTPNIEIATKVYSTGTTSHNTPSITPSWGTASGSSLFITLALGTFASGTSNTVDDVTSCTPDSNYTNLGYAYNSTGTGDQRTVAAAAWRDVETATEDPSAWTILDDPMDIQSYTIAVERG